MKKLASCIALILFSCTAIAKTDHLTVVLDWTPNTAHAPLVIAAQQGFFKEHGLTVEMVYPKKTSDATRLVTEKKVDLGLAYEPWFIKQVDQGAPLVRVGTYIDKPLNCIVALKQSGIKNIADLKGKEIGASGNTFTQTILMNLLEKEGIAKQDIKLTPVHENLSNALVSHQVDAISGSLRNLEVPALEKRGQKLVVFFPEEHGTPSYSELIFITHQDNRHDTRIAKFLAAVKQGVRYLDEHPQEAWQAFTKQYPQLDTAMNREYWFATLPYYAEDPAAYNPEDLKHFTDFMVKNRLISRAQPLDRYMTITG